ncbi:hypothetical protein FQN60_012336 [Etheostoma spectabile]|uniref:Uncharacterized protein n=1 Tax=Etheostoma spectabile TaxID=54343 RepID=A0A5J5DPJ8_9PERO|nr:hypothetical protein FQN60_012336 [Etheostoma spectabile]
MGKLRRWTEGSAPTSSPGQSLSHSVTQSVEPFHGGAVGLFLLFLLIIILIVAVSDLLGSQGEQVGRFDLAEGAGQLGAFALQVLAVAAVGAVARGQWRLCVDIHVGVFHRRLVGHLGRRRQDTI